MLFLAVPAVLGCIAFVLLVIGALITGDMGGPLFFPAVCLAGLVYALCVAELGVVFFLVTGGIQLLRRRIRVSAWIPVALAFPIAFTVVAWTRAGGVFVSRVVSAAFLTYWLAFTGSDVILKWGRKKWANRR